MRRWLLAVGAALTQTACAEKPVPVTDLRPFKPIPWACEGPDAAKGKARSGIIAHNSKLASLKAGKEIVYADDCPKETS